MAARLLTSVGRVTRSGWIAALLPLQACVEPPPDEVAAAEAGAALVVDSDDGLARATIDVDGGSFAQGSNAFGVLFEPHDGSSEIELLEVTTFMPAHSHGTSPVTLVEQGPASYRIEDMDLFMPGFWEVGLGVEVGQAADRFVFGVDVR